MRKIAVIMMTLLAVALLGCSQKTEALAKKNLMTRPLIHPHATAAAPNPHSDNAKDEAAQTPASHP